LNIDLVSDNRHFFGIAKLIKKVLESKLNPFNINSRNEPIPFTSQHFYLPITSLNRAMVKLAKSSSVAASQYQTIPGYNFFFMPQ
jgi:hypothetical protein